MALVRHDPNAHALMPSGAVPEEVQRVHEEIVRRVTTGDMCTVLQVLNAYPDQISATLIDPDGSSPLHLTARGGHLALVRELLKRGASVNALDAKKRTPLHVACEEIHADLALELLFAGAPVNALDASSETALHKATRIGASVEILQVLIEHGGADPTIGDQSLATPLMIAASMGKSDLVEYFVKRDPLLVFAENSRDWTALHLAAQGREERKRSVRECREGKFAACCRFLLEANAAVNCHDEDRKSPLHRSASSGNWEAAQELLKWGAAITDRDNCRWTPLHYAVQAGQLTVAKLLLDSKADVQTPEGPCMQPLALATMENQVEAAELLVKYKADPNLRSKGVASAMMIARKDPEKYTEVLGLFELGWINHA
eukprot:TRINITY_DN80819_c0_g1_i1.p1 TRINITY_DN80819_c0_g1~~TRINITY_DN80819_c0_g1_i1.p1  ORF type:complete len:373 (-),score=57.26 TRINITY_DN80819_c0_g1_i1:194-1312(-)